MKDVNLMIRNNQNARQQHEAMTRLCGVRPCLFGLNLGRLATATAVLVAILPLMTSCSKSMQSPNTAAGVRSDQSQPLRFAQLPITYSVVTYIAEANGYFKEEGLDYSSISLPTGPDVVTALKGNNGTAAGAGGIAITPVVTMIAGGGHPIILATTLTSSRQVKLVTFSGTRITSIPSTLRGKRIGVTRNTNGDLYLSRLLKKGGLTNKDVTLVSGRPADLRRLLLQGDIDAAVLWDPFVVQAVREYRHQIAQNKVISRGQPEVLVDPSLATLAFNIVTTDNKLDQNRDQMVRMLRATIKAEIFIHRNPKQAQALVEQWLKLQPGDLTDFFSTTEFEVYLNVPQTKVWMRSELAWVHGNHPDTRIPADLSPFIDASVLKSVDPSRVKE